MHSLLCSVITDVDVDILLISTVFDGVEYARMGTPNMEARIALTTWSILPDGEKVDKEYECLPVLPPPDPALTLLDAHWLTYVIVIISDNFQSDLNDNII